MADITLNPTTEPVPATTRLKDYRGQKTFYPAEGNQYAVLYIETTPGNALAAKAKIDQAIALAEDSQMVIGTAASDEGMRTSVGVVVTQLPNVPKE